MSLSASSGGPTLGGMRVAARRLEVAWPVLATALVYACFIGALLAAAHGNAEILVQFGRLHLSITHPPPGAPIVPSYGYDGQLYWLQAHDPLLLQPSTIARLAGTSPSYSLQRVAYPALAWLLAGGHNGGLAWSLLAVNVLAVLGLTTAVALDCRRQGRSTAWALVVGLAPGLLVATSRDLSDVLATTCMIGGLLALRRDRGWLAGLLLAVAALSREPMVLAAVAVAVEVAARAARALPHWARVRAELRRGLPAIAVPLIAYLGWKAYTLTLPVPHLAGATSSHVDAPIFPPFSGLWAAVSATLHAGGPALAFRLPNLLLVAAGVLASLGALRRGLTASSVMAALYAALVISVIEFSDNIELTRYTAPMFLCLLLTGLERRSRSALAIAAAASATVVLLPLVGG